MAFIFGILLTIGMWYIVYQHFATPFKILKKTKEIKEITNELNKFNEESEKIVEEILNDSIYQERVAPLKQELINGEITYEKFKEICTELAKERYYELYKDDEYDGDEEDDEYDGDEEDDKERNKKFLNIVITILIIMMILSSLIGVIAYFM